MRWTANDGWNIIFSLTEDVESHQKASIPVFEFYGATRERQRVRVPFFNVCGEKEQIGLERGQ